MDSSIDTYIHKYIHRYRWICYWFCFSGRLQLIRTLSSRWKWSEGLNHFCNIIWLKEHSLWHQGDMHVDILVSPVSLNKLSKYSKPHFPYGNLISWDLTNWGKLVYSRLSINANAFLVSPLFSPKALSNPCEHSSLSELLHNAGGHWGGQQPMVGTIDA